MLNGRPASEIFSWKSVTARKMGLSGKQSELTEDELLRLMVEEPNLVRRPLFVVDGEIVPGFDKASKAVLEERLGRRL